jgi:hypothetical protein
MSTKATLFYPGPDHVYIETLDWSIVFEISKEYIEKIQYRAFNKDNNECYFEEIDLEELDYIVIQTRANYDFSDSFKKYAFDRDGFYFSLRPNTLNRLFFKLEELQFIETDKKVYRDDDEEICLLWDIEITIKKDSEWYKEYLDCLERNIKNDKERIGYIKDLINDTKKK